MRSSRSVRVRLHAPAMTIAAFSPISLCEMSSTRSFSAWWSACATAPPSSSGRPVHCSSTVCRLLRLFLRQRNTISQPFCSGFQPR